MTKVLPSPEELSIDALHTRLRGELKAAMKARDTERVEAMCVILAELDNAEVIPVNPPEKLDVEGPLASALHGQPII